MSDSDSDVSTVGEPIAVTVEKGDDSMSKTQYGSLDDVSKSDIDIDMTKPKEGVRMITIKIYGKTVATNGYDPKTGRQTQSWNTINGAQVAFRADATIEDVKKYAAKKFGLKDDMEDSVDCCIGWRYDVYRGCIYSIGCPRFRCMELCTMPCLPWFLKGCPCGLNWKKTLEELDIQDGDSLSLALRAYVGWFLHLPFIVIAFFLFAVGKGWIKSKP